MTVNFSSNFADSIYNKWILASRILFIFTSKKTESIKKNYVEDVYSKGQATRFISMEKKLTTRVSCLITTNAETRDGHLSKDYSLFFVFILIWFGLCFREVTLLVSFQDFGELVKITSSFGFKNN